MYQRLKMLCKERGTTVTKLCEEVTGNSGNLATWKKGYMRSDYLSKAADILEVSADYILDRSDSPTSTYSISNKNTIVNGTQANIINGSEQFDEMTIELIKLFKELSFTDKMDIMNKIIEKSKK